MGALRRDINISSHQDEEDDWKIAFNCFAIFYCVKPMYQEQELSGKRTDPVFRAQLGLVGSVQQNWQIHKGDAWVLLGKAHFVCPQQWSGSS